MFPHLVARLFDTPLMMEPGKAAVIADALGPRLLGHPVSLHGVEMGVLGNPLYREEAEYVRPDIIDGVAIIPVEGSLVAKGKWVNSYSGETSYEGIQAQIASVRADRGVRGVVLEVDSFGGEAAGAFSCAEAIHALAAEKPTIAILTENACSGGYLLAAATRAIVIPETGHAGSIGVVTMHASVAGALEKAGVDVTIIKSGAHKADFNPYEKLPTSVARQVQADMDSMRDLFAVTVARYRGGRLSRDAALETEAAVYRGAAALAAGLVDAVADPIEAFAAFVAEIGRSATIPA